MTQTKTAQIMKCEEILNALPANCNLLRVKGVMGRILIMITTPNGKGVVIDVGRDGKGSKTALIPMSERPDDMAAFNELMGRRMTVAEGLAGLAVL